MYQILLKNFFLFLLAIGGREIKELGVRCANMERGCRWTGTIGTLDNHIATCQFAMVPCPNKCEDDKGAGELHLMKKHLDKHLKKKCPKRPYECQHCGEKGTYASVTVDHDKVCDKKIVPCPNKGSGCPSTMERGKTKQHVRSACDYTEIPCAYGSLGCGVRMLRKDIKKHQENDDKAHLHLALHTVCTLEEQNKTLSEGEAVVFKLPGYASKKEKKEIFYSKQFYSSSSGYKICTRIDVNGFGTGTGTHVSIFTELLEGHYDDQLHWPFQGTFTYELLNQLADGNHHVMLLILYTSSDMHIGSSRGHHKFISHSSLSYNPVTNTQYLLDDTLYFRVSVKVNNHKPWLVCTDNIHTDSVKVMKTNKPLQDGLIVFKVTCYSERKETNNRFYSCQFYTNPGGYMIQTEVDVNGYGSGNGTHVSVFARLLEGAYDAGLSWPFMGTVTFTLLNQLEDTNHHSWTLKYETSDHALTGSIWGKTLFISHFELSHVPVKNIQYLKNDTLYFRVTVTVAGHMPWLDCTY